MEKKINKKIQNVIIKKEALKLLNSELEKYVLNSNVLVVVDFLTYKNHKVELENLKSCGLNNLVIKVLVNNFDDEFLKLIDETFSFVVGIGENWLLEKTKNFAIKNNINYGFVNLFLPKTTIFLKKTVNFCYYPPCFVLIEEKKFSKQEQFFMLCDLFKYSFLIVESSFDFENKNLFEFSKRYEEALTNICSSNFKNFCENSFDRFLIENLVGVGLLLQKYEIEKGLSSFENEFNNLASNFVLGYQYKNIFLKLNPCNLFLERIQKLNLNLFEYEKIDIKFYRIFLLNFKNKFLKNVELFLGLCFDLLSFLKQNFFEVFYQNSLTFDFEINKIDYDKTFLKKMSFFEIFKVDINI